MPAVRHGRGVSRCFVLVAFLAVGAAGTSAEAQASAAPAGCSAGAQTLAPEGSRTYPDTDNGGYTSVNRDLYMT